MEAKVTLSTMHFYSHHGCYVTERKVGGRFTVDLVYTYDAREISISDEVGYGVSYLDVYDYISVEMAVESNTLESVCRRILEGLLRRFECISSCTLQISKLGPPLGGDVGAASVSMSLCR